MLLLAWALQVPCRAVGLSEVGFWIVGLAVAVAAGWTGRGLELSTLVGNAYIQPTTYAHAFVLMAVGHLVMDRFAAAAFLAGLACLVHVQIGAAFAVVLLLAAGARRVAQGLGEGARCAALFLLPASPALWHLVQMVRGGVLASSWSFEYIEFRIPHNYALSSTAAVAWVGAYLAVQGGVHWWLRATGRREARPVGVLFRMSLWLAALSAAHVVDYMLVRHGAVAKMTLVRMSLLITVFWIVSLVAGAEV